MELLTKFTHYAKTCGLTFLLNILFEKTFEIVENNFVGLPTASNIEIKAE